LLPDDVGHFGWLLLFSFHEMLASLTDGIVPPCPIATIPIRQTFLTALAAGLTAWRLGTSPVFFKVGVLP
jgi:hypothetical protein